MIKTLFSVLISVYHKDDPQYLHEALESIEGQTLQPDEIVLVKDGVLSSDLEEVILQHMNHTDITYRILALTVNGGLGAALKEGLAHCRYDLVARMDADDISIPDRFEKQISFMKKYPEVDIVGGWICEFDTSASICEQERRTPISHEEIERFSCYRNPMNHVTVMFRKKAVETVGGYRTMHGFEDYDLWMRMLLQGRRFSNIPEVLVKVRIGEGMIARRQGWQYAKDEWKLEKAAYKLGFWSSFDIVRNIFIRILPRLLPVVIVEKLYNLLRKI
jgi:glycosyltransferase involved in cell wall biosynthesis